MADLLLVDNDARITELVAFFLRKRGHAVRIAPSFTEARAAVRAARPDLMLSDLDLGAERGDEELPKMSLEGLLPPTLVVSGYLDAHSEALLSGLDGVVGLLRKPFDMHELEARIATALALANRIPEPMGKPGRAPDEGDGWIDVQPWGVS